MEGKNLKASVRQAKDLTKAIKILTTMLASLGVRLNQPSDQLEEATLVKEDLKSFIDERFQAMLRAPLTWGGPEALELQCFLLIEIQESILGQRRDVSPQGDLFQSFRRKRIPRCPGPMTVSTWFTDPIYGWAQGRTDVLGVDDTMKAAQEVVEFFVAWSEHLKED